MIEHRARPGWKLIDTPKPFETTPSVYRFKGVAAANKMTTLMVKEESIEDERIVLIGADVSRFDHYIAMGDIPREPRSTTTCGIS